MIGLHLDWLVFGQNFTFKQNSYILNQKEKLATTKDQIDRKLRTWP